MAIKCLLMEYIYYNVYTVKKMKKQKQNTVTTVCTVSSSCTDNIGVALGPKTHFPDFSYFLLSSLLSIIPCGTNGRICLNIIALFMFIFGDHLLYHHHLQV